jgi:hypothetical protein
MSAASSIFIDRASTNWPSYLLLEQLIAQLNGCHVPRVLQDRCPVDLDQVIKNRRIVWVHLTKRKQHHQNSVAWLKIEPIDLLAHPVAYTSTDEIERIFGKAVTDAEFLRTLKEDPEKAALSIGVRLSKNEVDGLKSIDFRQIERFKNIMATGRE